MWYLFLRPFTLHIALAGSRVSFAVQNVHLNRKFTLRSLGVSVVFFAFDVFRMFYNCVFIVCEFVLISHFICIIQTRPPRNVRSLARFSTILWILLAHVFIQLVDNSYFIFYSRRREKKVKPNVKTIPFLVDCITILLSNLLIFQNRFESLIFHIFIYFFYFLLFAFTSSKWYCTL